MILYGKMVLQCPLRHCKAIVIVNVGEFVHPVVDYPNLAKIVGICANLKPHVIPARLLHQPSLQKNFSDEAGFSHDFSFSSAIRS
ncbi:hypothetical protein DF048_31920 [Burkholderia seminalis]|nr:hypothetical protein DF048_31920 [Burkholderia seminalis]